MSRRTRFGECDSVPFSCSSSSSSRDRLDPMEVAELEEAGDKFCADWSDLAEERMCVLRVSLLECLLLWVESVEDRDAGFERRVLASDD